METKILFTEKFPSIVSRGELPAYLKKFAEEKGYPVGRIHWSESQKQFFGYGQGYLVSASQLPPIPGGWDVVGEEAPIEERKIWIPEMQLRSIKPESGLPRLLDSYVNEGLLFQETSDKADYYDMDGKVYLVKGHPNLLDTFEQVLDDF